ncbi:hypothetical protein DID78_05255 [Candidatus Marinamargulisbacteria bacterium SCGC AG-343-D04]|nr:hypothetical protein DID78_05255 [Candidatus Marinamargulisbacteria bacterium SCGC AG-343-D04]
MKRLKQLITIITNKCVNHPLWVLIAFYSLHLLWLDKVPHVALDEPWFINTADNVAKGLGFINTAKGYAGGETFFLLPSILWIPLKLWGVSLFTARMTTFCIGIVALIGFIKILKELGVSKRIQLGVGSFLVVGNMFFVIFHWVRPEALVLTLVIWALLFVIRACQTGAYPCLIWSCFLLSLSCLAHPYAVSLCAVFALFIATLCIKQKTISPLLFSVGGLLITVSIVVGFVSLFSSWSIYVQDIINQVSRRVPLEASKWVFFKDNIGQFFQTYSLGFKRGMILIVELFFLSLGIVYNKNKAIRYVSLAGFGGLLISFVGYFFRRRYFGVFLIFSYVIMALLLKESKEWKNRYLKGALVLVLSLYFVNNLLGDMYILKKMRHATPFHHIETELKKIIPDNSTVISHLQFWTALSHVNFKVNSLVEIQNAKEGDYVVISDVFQHATSPTTGENNDVHNVKTGESVFFNEAINELTQHAYMEARITTKGYGNIMIWKYGIDSCKF